MEYPVSLYLCNSLNSSSQKRFIEYNKRNYRTIYNSSVEKILLLRLLPSPPNPALPNTTILFLTRHQLARTLLTALRKTEQVNCFLSSSSGVSSLPSSSSVCALNFNPQNPNVFILFRNYNLQIFKN